MSELKDQLHKLYSDASKHSAYQSVPDFVSTALGYTESIDEGWRGDRPRLAYLLRERAPRPGERWCDFGANTGFFVLSLAHRYPDTKFIAIEANTNHCRFIESVAEHFQIDNLEIDNRAVGFNELETLPRFDFLLHQNVLHHAGHDFDRALVDRIDLFQDYARRYLASLRAHASGMLFQLGSNWGGDKRLPWVDSRADAKKLRTTTSWLIESGWQLTRIAYPEQTESSEVRYQTAFPGSSDLAANADTLLASIDLDVFPGEFYRRPLFICSNS